MDTTTPQLTAAFWRTRRSAAVAGIIFAVLLLTAMSVMRIAVRDADPLQLSTNHHRRELYGLGVQLVPFAGIAFLWFIGVVREQIGPAEDRLFSSVFLGSGLLMVTTLFLAAVNASTMLSMLSRRHVDAELWQYVGGATDTLISTYAMRMAAVFTLSVSTLGLRTRAFPRWVSAAGYIVALVLLVTPGNRSWSPLLFPAWVLLLSLVILVTRPSTDDAEGRGS